MNVLKSNDDFLEKYPYACKGTLVSMHITEILTKNSYFLSTHNDIDKIYEIVNQ